MKFNLKKVIFFILFTIFIIICYISISYYNCYINYTSTSKYKILKDTIIKKIELNVSNSSVNNNIIINSKGDHFIHIIEIFYKSHFEETKNQTFKKHSEIVIEENDGFYIYIAFGKDFITRQASPLPINIGELKILLNIQSRGNEYLFDKIKDTILDEYDLFRSFNVDVKNDPVLELHRIHKTSISNT